MAMLGPSSGKPRRVLGGGVWGVSSESPASPKIEKSIMLKSECLTELHDPLQSPTIAVDALRGNPIILSRVLSLVHFMLD